jgi:hypothetical protein
MHNKAIYIYHCLCIGVKLVFSQCGKEIKQRIWHFGLEGTGKNFAINGSSTSIVVD